jgi:hypothetical protein
MIKKAMALKIDARFRPASSGRAPHRARGGGPTQTGQDESRSGNTGLFSAGSRYWLMTV